MIDNPQILSRQLKSTVEEVAQFYVYSLVLKGIKDDSLPNIPYPLEFTETPEKVERKCRFLQQMVKGIGIETDLISENVIQKLKEYTLLYQK